MNKLLILGSAILAVDPIETADGFSTADLVLPKHVIDGYQLAEVALPTPFSPIDYIWAAGGLTLNPGTAEQVAAARLRLSGQLEARRLQRQVMGLVYEFPDGAGTIQTREASTAPDIANINGLTTAAVVLQVQGVTDLAIDFRDEQNVTHALTPGQAIAMGMAVSAFLSATYAVKWAKGAEIEALATILDVDAYEMDAGWPV